MPSLTHGATSYMANGGCYRCSRGDNLIDMDASIVGEGSLALCVGCITEAAEAAGLTFNSAYVRQLEAELAARDTADQPIELITIPRPLFDKFLARYFHDEDSEDEDPEPAPDDSVTRCIAIKKDGSQCNGRKHAGREVCNIHAKLPDTGTLAPEATEDTAD